MIIVAVAVAACVAYLLWQIISADLSEKDYSPSEDMLANTPLEEGPPRWLLKSDVADEYLELEAVAIAQPD